MNITCQCPSAAAIPDVPNASCAQSFGQIQKVALTRMRDADGNKNSFTSTASILLLASWETFLAATDGTKIVVSPYINAPADSGGDIRLTGGGNDDLGGIPEVLGGNPVQFTGQMRGIPQDIAAAMKQLICESNAGNLGVYLFDEAGNIEAIKDADTAGKYYPIPIRAFFVGDKIHGNYDAKDNNPISWYYQEGYSDNLVILKPTDFNPLTDLLNGGSNSGGDDDENIGG